MSEHPIENLMVTAMSSLRDMIDVNTILGDTIETVDGTVIIPVSKVSFGFAAGGSEFNTNKLNKFSENAKLPFGGGSGAGVKINPVAFLVVKDSNVKLLTVEADRPLDKLVDIVPDLLDKTMELVNSKLCKNKKPINMEN
ncbi:MAG: GerW family sporulation protein [Clostridia bacterium]|nr:GerW family sporulation protein [Clostridia bacterium]